MVSERKKINLNEMSIVIPAYDEELGILKNIDVLLLGMNNSDICHEVIVVDDGSTDHTNEILKNISAIKLIRHDQNKGYGASIKTGIKNAEYENIVITDADGTYPNERIPDLFHTFKDGGFDMVVGARTVKNVKIPILRKPAKWLLNKLANYLTNTKIPDLNSGLRVMRKEVVTKFMNILPDGFSFTTTITLALLANGYSIEFIPIGYYKRVGKSKIKPIRDTLYFLKLIFRTIMYFNPMKIFLPFSILFFIPGFAFLVRDILNLNLAQTSVLLVVTGSIILSIGMLADLINKRMN